MIAAPFTMVKTWRQPKCLRTDEWIKKMWYMNTHMRAHTRTHAHTHTHTMEYYSAIKRHGIMPFAATQMGLEIITLNEISQKEKDKYHMISLTSGI